MGNSSLSKEINGFREPAHRIDPLFPNRWSPRAMSGESLEKEELLRLFEAARWAPSAFNSQPWRFLYSFRDTSSWELFFGALSENNKRWAKNAAVLILVLSQRISDYNGKPLDTHSFDAGAAWENLALQGSLMGLVVHGMSGFDYDKARRELSVPEDYQVEAMIAVGRRGKAEELPEEQRAKEFPSGRKPIGEFAFEGRFGK
jgi:nitroreductase